MHNTIRMGHSAKIIMMMTFCLLALCHAISPAHANKKYASIVMDAETGMIISQRYADKVLHPASLTKMMTMMMAFDALEQRKISLKDRIRISHHAASMQPSKLALPVGSSIKVDDALKALAVKSANDIAVAMAEFLGGSEKNFARQMTRKAHSIGMTKTRFINASGLHDPRQVSTARDMARLSRYLIYRYPDYYHYFSMRSFSYRGKTYGTHNKLMKTYKGMDGLKTGYILASGFNLAASAKRDGRRIIGVVFGGRSSRTRNAHMQKLLDRGFKALKKRPDYYNSRPRSSVLFTKAPIPTKKPGQADMLMAQGMPSIEPAAGAAMISSTQERIIDVIASTINDRRQNMMVQKLGQGDRDDDSAMRFQTGLMAIAAHTRKEYSIEGIGRYGGAKPKLLNANISPAQVQKDVRNWSVQLGAFRSRSQTDSVLRRAYKKLPLDLRYGRSIIIPARVDNIILFRGRLTGYTEAHANRICQMVNDCIVVEP